MEVIRSAYSVVALEGDSGEVLWRISSYAFHFNPVSRKGA